MAKLKNSFTNQKNKKPPVAGAGNLASGSLPGIAMPRELAARILSPSASTPASNTLKFGTMHTKPTASTSSPGSQWMSLLNTASSGATTILGGGLFSLSGFSFVGKLLSLFGGGKSTPAAPVAFQSPVPKQNSFNITTSDATSSVSLGVHTLSPSGTGSGVYPQSGSVMPDHQTQSAQVVQIVKQALLTSSSLNDLIAEI
jgi:hypothetical protein